MEYWYLVVVVKIIRMTVLEEVAGRLLPITSRNRDLYLGGIIHSVTTRVELALRPRDKNGAEKQKEKRASGHDSE